MAASTASKVVLMAVLMILAFKDLGNADWAVQADEADDASHLALDENFFSENDDSSGLEVDGTSEQPTIFGEKTATAIAKGDPVITVPPEKPTTLGKETTITEKDVRDTSTPSEIVPTSFEEETTATSEKDGIDTGTPSEIPTVFGEDTTMALDTGDGLAVGTTSEIPSFFGEETTDSIGEEGEGSGIEETTIPPAVTELITEETIDAEAQLKSTQATESPDHETDSGTRSGPTPTVIPTFHTEQKAETSESTETVATEEPLSYYLLPLSTATTLVEKFESASSSFSFSALSSSGPTTTSAESTVITDQPTSTTETSVIKATTEQPTARPAAISPTTDEEVGSKGALKHRIVNKSGDPCNRTFCKNGYMCVPTEDGESAECRCPSECPQSVTPCCSVYSEEYGNICEMHHQACGLGLNIALRNMGKCSEGQSGSGYVPTLVAEEMAPAAKCSWVEVMQFASRFQEWAMINKEIAAESKEVDLNSAIVQARLTGLSSFESKQILKHQFTAMDVNKNRQLDKSEVEAFLRFVPSEHCLYGFMVSSDVDRNSILSRDEWYGAFQFQSKGLVKIDFGSKL